MIDVNLNASPKLPVLMLSTADGTPRTGLAFGDVTVTVEKADGTSTTVSLSAPDWVENVTGAFLASGKYTLRLPSTATDQTGPLAFAVKATGADAFVGFVRVVDGDLPATQAGLDAVNTNIAMLDSRLQVQEQAIVKLYNFAGGRWKIHRFGPDANRIVYYADDGVTIIAKFDLKDAGGLPTVTAAFERIPVP